MSLLAMFEAQAKIRGLLPSEAKLSAANVFSLVRDMKYQRASASDLESIIREWRSTEIGKHRLLEALFDELGLDARLMMCTCEFTEEKSEHLPRSLRVQLSAGPIPDVHTFLRVETDDGWMDVDATWPLETRSLGLPVNEAFEMGVSMELACEPIQIFYVPSDSDPHDFRDDLIETHCAGQYRSRSYFVEGMGRWVRESSGK